MIGKQYNRAIILDPEGFVVQLVQWEKEKPKPRLPTPNQCRRMGFSGPLRYLSADHYEPGCEQWRWIEDHWEKPDAVAYLVGPQGLLRKTVHYFSAFPERAADVPDGWTVTDKAPPKNTAQRPYFNGTDWKFPIPVAKMVQDDAGDWEVVNVELEKEEEPVEPKAEDNWVKVRPNGKHSRPDLTYPEGDVPKKGDKFSAASGWKKKAAKTKG